MSDGGGVSLPARPAPTPGLPENFHPVNWEKFDGLNTKSPRPAIADGEYYWGDGFMPIGPSNMRILWGTGASAYTAPFGKTVLWFAFGNVGDTPYGTALLSDGTVDFFYPTTSGSGTIMPSGTIQNPSTIFGFSQWGSKYLIFAKDQTNGYWLWDGTNLYTAGTVGPEVTLDNAGQGYTSLPTISMQTTGSGTGISYQAVIQNGEVSQVNVISPGSGFAVGDFAILTFAGGGTDDQAVLSGPTITTTAGGLSEVYVITAGNKYSSEAHVQVSGGGGSSASVSLSIQNGAITGAAIVTAGTGYTSPPTLTIVDPGVPGQGIPGGSGGQIGCAVAFGQITSIGVSYGGTGYVGLPTIKIVGDGAGATAIPVISGGAVTSVLVTNNGSGYTKALAVVQGGNNAANATPTLMPFGISGTAIEVFSNRVWVTNGSATAAFPPKNRTIFSDGNSPVSFSNDGGAFQSTDSFLRVGYHFMKQTNGFLYLGGDSSLNYISGVQTSTPSGSATGSATTTFNNINVDPQLGSPWPSSVQVFSRNIVFANTVGIFVSYGGAVTKASLPLDGFYASGPIFGATSNYSSAVAHIFGIPVYMLLLPVVDQYTGQLVNKLLMWDGKRWFTSQQDKNLTYVSSQEINSVLTAWGTDGTDIFPLFDTPSIGFTKVLRSKLFSAPGYYFQKTATRINGVVNSYTIDETLRIAIDSEVGGGSGNAVVAVTPAAGSISWFNNVSHPIVWNNNASQAINWGGPGLDVFGPYPIAQQGRMIGMTIDTIASDLAVLSLNLTQQVYTANV